jgi:hypothetical protein
MRTVRCCAGLALLALAFGLAPVRAQDKVEIKVVKYQGLADAVKAQKGKVVVVDFWWFS